LLSAPCLIASGAHEIAVELQTEFLSTIS
jgi:hypothetical protein